LPRWISIGYVVDRHPEEHAMARKMTRKEEPNRFRDTQTLIRLTQSDKDLLVRLSEDYGLSMNDVVMLLVRQEAKRRGMTER
jgi:predicted nucleic acid-binding protein